MQPFRAMFRCFRRVMAIPRGGLCLLLVLCTAAAAQDRGGTEVGAQASRYAMTPAEAAEIRANLSHIIATLDVIATQRELGDLSELMAIAEDALAYLPDEDLGVYLDAMPGIRRSLEIVDDMVLYTQREVSPSSFHRDLNQGRPARLPMRSTQDNAAKTDRTPRISNLI